ncbi:MAG: preprotein translocase subunit SecG [Thermoanaerobaculia bacterium]
MYIALVTVYILICFFLILVVLLQQGKGADIAGAFGGGGSQTAFGARGATTILHKLTTGAFVAFILMSLLLSILEARPRSSVIKTLPAAAAAQKAPAPAPAAPAPAPAAGSAQPAAPPAPGTAQPSPGSPAKP